LGRFLCAARGEEYCAKAHRSRAGNRENAIHFYRQLAAPVLFLLQANRKGEKMMKKKMMTVLMTAAMVLSVTACGSQGEKEEAASLAQSDGGAVQADAGTEQADGGQYTIGISQFAEHGSLDNCRQGFLAGLAEAGIEEGKNLTIVFDNAQADMGTASTISDAYVSQKVDLICAIATPTAMSAYNSCMNTDIPVIYTAVSDPVQAGLAEAGGKSVGNITGTSDALPVTEQLKMIREMLPEAEKIGILYTTSEANSVSTIEAYKESAAEYGFEIVETGINTIADVPMAAADMADKVDCITNLTDNTVVSALQTVLDEANKKGIPVFGSEIEQVRSGCVASMGLDYVALGKQTGAMAAKVLKGEAKAADMPFEVITQASLYVNTAAAEKINLEIPEDMANRAVEIFDEIVVE